MLTLIVLQIDSCHLHVVMPTNLRKRSSAQRARKADVEAILTHFYTYNKYLFKIVKSIKRQDSFAHFI